MKPVQRNKAPSSGRACCWRRAVLVGVMAVVPVVVGAQQSGKTFAYSWREVAGGLDSIVPLHWLRWSDLSDMSSALRRAKAAADAMPPGHRALFSWDLHNSMAHHPQDVLRDATGSPAVCRDPSGRGAPYPGVWWERGRAEVRARFAEFFTRYAAIGGAVDVVVLDFEQVPTTWFLYQQAQRNACGIEAYFAAIAGDPRFGRLAGRLGFAELERVIHWYRGDEYLKWNGVMHELFAEQVNAAVYEPVRSVFPTVKMSNYGFYYQDPSHHLPDLNGHHKHRYYAGVHIGTHQSRELYGWLGNVSRLKLDGRVPYERNPYNAFRYALNKVRAMKLSSSVPIYPWISYKRFKDSLLRDSDYYQELLLHIALTGIEDFLYWNPLSVDPPASDADNRLVDRTLKELDRLLGVQDRRTLVERLVGWGDDWVLTGMRVNGTRIVWRFTPRLNPGQAAESVLISAEPAVFRVNGSSIAVEGGSVVERGGVSNSGFWIVGESIPGTGVD